jgi:outer membrane protein assembly factor BamE (lipoprotein component of BamABCDE complex)
MLRAWSFAIRDSFVIRSSSFNFPSMKNILRSRLLILLLSALFAFTACHGKRLTKANVDEVSQGMTRKQVESILGPPTSIDSTDLLILKKVTYIYQQADESVTIVFVNDEVSSKESTLHD